MDDKHTRSATLRTARTDDGTTVVTLGGDLDLLAVIALGPALDDLTCGPRPDVVLDLRPVTFVDCCGLGLLCRARGRVLAGGGRLRLAGPGAGFTRLLRHAGLAGAFEVIPQPAATAAR
ncbi:STAS domain-containing protein [Streptomyces roseirectus]|uniref:Anti-sigma factor antagonist n=1 Tax=Streptomyces roseirectus TaxID=2768066 RepID=A0A7H0I682_9ACTN|nr:STAS domain-containing protein [Streptomyces roseirectus]QNP68298.1 STAS domain-containing protein [Streptomyces roseirectus]